MQAQFAPFRNGGIAGLHFGGAVTVDVSSTTNNCFETGESGEEWLLLKIGSEILLAVDSTGARPAQLRFTQRNQRPNNVSLHPVVQLKLMAPSYPELRAFATTR